MTPDSAERILLAGGNLICNALTKESCVRLALAAKSAGTHITFVGSLNAESMAEVAEAGRGHVTFDVAHYPVGK